MPQPITTPDRELTAAERLRRIGRRALRPTNEPGRAQFTRRRRRRSPGLSAASSSDRLVNDGRRRTPVAAGSRRGGIITRARRAARNALRSIERRLDGRRRR